MGNRKLSRASIEARVMQPLLPAAVCGVLTLPFIRRAIKCIRNIVRIAADDSKRFTFMQKLENGILANGLEVCGCLFLITVGILLLVKYVRRYRNRSRCLDELDSYSKISTALMDYKSSETLYFDNGNALGTKYVFIAKSGMIIPYHKVRGVQVIGFDYYKYTALARGLRGHIIRRNLPSGNSGMIVYTEYGSYPLFEVSPELCEVAKRHLEQYAPKVRVD